MLFTDFCLLLSSRHAFFRHEPGMGASLMRARDHYIKKMDRLLIKLFIFESFLMNHFFIATTPLIGGGDHVIRTVITFLFGTP